MNSVREAFNDFRHVFIGYLAVGPYHSTNNGAAEESLLSRIISVVTSIFHKIGEFFSAVAQGVGNWWSQINRVNPEITSLIPTPPGPSYSGF